MNILDLKKLMLVPLVCWASIQQVDAEVKEDREAEKKLQSENFADIVKRYQETGIKQQFPDPLSVACKMHIGPNMQMGGLIAFIQDNAKARKVFVYQGAKQKSDPPRNMPPRNDLPNSLLAVNNYSHTERQLVSAVITKIKEENVGLSGAMHIYTYMPPCADTHKDENGQLTCCEYYPLVATQFKNIEFHIYFKYPTLNDLRTYFDFDTVQK